MGKCIIKAKPCWPTVPLSFFLKPGTQDSANSALHCYLLWVNQWLGTSSVTFRRWSLSHCLCKHQKSISPQSRENESAEDPKDKLSISCLKSTPLPILCIFCAWLYTLAGHKSLPVRTVWGELTAHFPSLGGLLLLAACSTVADRTPPAHSLLASLQLPCLEASKGNHTVIVWTFEKHL